MLRGVPDSPKENFRAGCGGAFAFCTLGNAITVKGMLSGDILPARDALARHVFYTATGTPLGSVGSDSLALIGETGTMRVHLLYQPDQTWLRSADAALTDDLGKRIRAANAGGKRCVVFGAMSFVSSRMLTAYGIEFCQLPYELFRAPEPV